MSQPEKRYMDEVTWRKVGGKVGDIYIKPDQSYWSFNVDLQYNLHIFFNHLICPKIYQLVDFNFWFGEHRRSPQTCVIKDPFFKTSLLGGEKISHLSLFQYNMKPIWTKDTHGPECYIECQIGIESTRGSYFGCQNKSVALIHSRNTISFFLFTFVLVKCFFILFFKVFFVWIPPPCY